MQSAGKKRERDEVRVNICLTLPNLSVEAVSGHILSSLEETVEVYIHTQVIRVQLLPASSVLGLGSGCLTSSKVALL